jgi:hypothetical protein
MKIGWWRQLGFASFQRWLLQVGRTFGIVPWLTGKFTERTSKLNIRECGKNRCRYGDGRIKRKHESSDQALRFGRLKVGEIRFENPIGKTTAGEFALSTHLQSRSHNTLNWLCRGRNRNCLALPRPRTYSSFPRTFLSNFDNFGKNTSAG